MVAWHRSIKADLGLRFLGLVLCGISFLAVSHLYGLRQAHRGGDPDFLCFGLAAIGFLAASAGGALTCLGNHLFDEVEVPARYRRLTYLSDTKEGW
jgi:hypothetical protein